MPRISEYDLFFWFSLFLCLCVNYEEVLLVNLYIYRNIVLFTVYCWLWEIFWRNCRTDVSVTLCNSRFITKANSSLLWPWGKVVLKSPSPLLKIIYDRECHWSSREFRWWMALIHLAVLTVSVYITSPCQNF